MSAGQMVMLGLAFWLAFGVFGLFDILGEMEGSLTWLTYLLVAVLMLPTMLTQLELRGWVRAGGGSYRLIQALERPGLSFLSGWAYLVGWLALSSALAVSFGEHAAAALGPLLPGYSLELPFVIGLLALSTIQLNAGFRPQWALTIRVATLIGFAVLALVGLTAPRGNPAGAAPSVSSLGASIALLGGSGWLLEYLTERRGTAGRGFALWPALVAVVAFAAWRWVPAPVTLRAIGDTALPTLGGTLMDSLAAVAIAAVWLPFTVIALRRLQFIGSEGVFPDWAVASPRRPVILLALVTLGAATASQLNPAFGVVELAQLAALSFLTLNLAVAGTSIVTERRQQRNDSVVLPLHPVIPVTGAVINSLLVLALPDWTKLAGLGLLALGAAAFWVWGRRHMRDSQAGLTVFETAEGVAQSKFPVLVPIANPKTADHLVALAVEIAEARNGHVQLLQVIDVPDHLPLDTRRYEARRQSQFIEDVLQGKEEYSVPVEGLTRLSRTVEQGILDTAAEEDSEVIVMGAHLSPHQIGNTGFGSIVDEVLDSATCAVVVMRSDSEVAPSHSLVPVSKTRGGLAAELAMTLTTERVTLLHVVDPAEEPEPLPARAARENGAGPEIETVVVQAETPLEGILSALDGQDLIVMEAGAFSVLTEGRGAQLPLKLAETTAIPIVLVRTAPERTRLVARRAWRSITDVLPQLDDEEKLALNGRMRIASQPTPHYFVLIGLSSVIATLGLELSSPAVVIGAMLVAPLMSPIISVAAGITFGDRRMIAWGLSATLQGVVLAIFVSTLVAVVSPGAHATPEVLARTSPRIIDLMVAIASGMAGAYAIAHKEVGEALPGVAIAAALVPPLSTIGIGLGLGDPAIAGGALLLFVTNLIAIVLSASVVFLLVGVRPSAGEERALQLRQGLLVSVVSLAAVSVPLAYLGLRSAAQETVEQQAEAVFTETVQTWGVVEIAELDVSTGRDLIALEATIYSEVPLDASQLQSLEQTLERELDRQAQVDIFVVVGDHYQTIP